MDCRERYDCLAEKPNISKTGLMKIVNDMSSLLRAERQTIKRVAEIRHAVPAIEEVTVLPSHSPRLASDHHTQPPGGRSCATASDWDAHHTTNCGHQASPFAHRACASARPLLQVHAGREELRDKEHGIIQELKRLDDKGDALKGEIARLQDKVRGTR